MDWKSSLIPQINLISEVAPLKLFLDMVASSCIENVTIHNGRMFFHVFSS